MAVATQAAFLSAAAYSTKIPDEYLRRDFLDRVKNLNISNPSSLLPVFTNAALIATASGSDIMSQICGDWIGAELPRMHSRFSPSLFGWQLQAEPLIERIDLEDYDNGRRWRSLHVDADDPASCKEAVIRRLPGPVNWSLIKFADGVSTNSALLIRGFPRTNTLPAIVLGIAAILGEPFTEENETQEIVQHIRPRPELAFSQSSASSEVALEDHIENVGTDRVPDWVALGCVQNFEKAETMMFHPLRAVYSMIQGGFLFEAGLLFDNKYWVRNPESFGNDRPKKYGMCILSGPPEHPQVHADFADMGSDSLPHAEAFECFKQHSKGVRESVCLTSGDILLLRNTGGNPPYLHQQIMHGRGPFKAQSIPGQERHLLRVFVRQVDLD